MDSHKKKKVQVVICCDAYKDAQISPKNARLLETVYCQNDSPKAAARDGQPPAAPLGGFNPSEKGSCKMVSSPNPKFQGENKKRKHVNDTNHL